MIKVKLQYEWQPAASSSIPVASTLFEVLYAVHDSGLLAEAARRVGMSYRHVWGLMGKWETIFGKPLVTLRKGQGASLTEFGRKLLWAEQLVQARLSSDLETVRHQIEEALSDPRAAAASALTICASHDLALAELRDRLLHREGTRLDVRFLGSVESLAALEKDDCVFAGFHVAEGAKRAETAPFRALLDPKRHVLVGFATRTQGLMVARGNPKRIAAIADLARPGMRIVNRQRGSGSRLEFDQLLALAGIDGSVIDGYQNEEYTHLAVAATIASGMADAGYGIRAAAARFALHYIPLLTERYYLACRREALRLQPVVDLLDLIRSEEFADIIAALPGYGATISGNVYDVREAFRPLQAAERPARKRSGGTAATAARPDRHG